MKDNSFIYCYTGTGNSFAAAKQVSEFFGGIPIRFITHELLEAREAIDCDTLIIVVPSYAYGVPLLVKKWLLKTKFSVNYLAAAVLQGSSQRGTLAEINKLLKKQKQAVSLNYAIDSVENYVHIFGHQKPEVIEERTLKQTEAVEKLCSAIENKETNTISLRRPLSRFVSFWFRIASHSFARSYRVTKDCNACEICRKVCPCDAIYMREKKGRSIPKFRVLRCDHCQACMQLCPKLAIKYFKITPVSPRYKHRDVSLAELIKRD